jgi:hypothetical protein
MSRFRCYLFCRRFESRVDSEVTMGRTIPIVPAFRRLQPRSEPMRQPHRRLIVHELLLA